MKQVNLSNWLVWVKYAHNDLGIAIREMEMDCNPRHRAYEAILINVYKNGQCAVFI